MTFCSRAWHSRAAQSPLSTAPTYSAGTGPTLHKSVHDVLLSGLTCSSGSNFLLIHSAASPKFTEVALGRRMPSIRHSCPGCRGVTLMPSNLSEYWPNDEGSSARDNALRLWPSRCIELSDQLALFSRSSSKSSLACQRILTGPPEIADVFCFMQEDNPIFHAKVVCGLAARYVDGCHERFLRMKRLLGGEEGRYVVVEPPKVVTRLRLDEGRPPRRACLPTGRQQRFRNSMIVRTACAQRLSTLSDGRGWYWLAGLGGCGCWLTE